MSGTRRTMLGIVDWRTRMGKAAIPASDTNVPGVSVPVATNASRRRRWDADGRNLENDKSRHRLRLALVIVRKREKK